MKTAQRLLSPQSTPSGLVALLERHRPDLTLEALVLQPRWKHLFTAQEIETARSRLPENLRHGGAEGIAASTTNTRTDSPFIIGNLYTRQDLYRLLDVGEGRQGGDWDTGYHKHDERWYIFAGVGVAGRTG